MKKNYLLLNIIFVIIFTACKNEIPFDFDYNTPKIILNTLIDYNKDTNFIAVALTKQEYNPTVNPPVVTVSVNGELKEQLINAELLNNPDFLLFSYKTDLSFSPGDKIKIEAEADNGKYHAYTEDILPVPIEIDNIDSMTYYNTVGPNLWRYLRIKILFTDNPHEKNFYRLEIVREDSVFGTSLHTNMDTVAVYYTNEEYDKSEDIVLSDGIPNFDKDDTKSILGGTYQNKSGVFDDNRLHGPYTMIVSIWNNPFLKHHEGIDSKKISSKLKVCLYSITEAQYSYLRALNYYLRDKDQDDDNYLMPQPVILPSNIRGGIGILGLSAGTTQTIKLPDE